MINDRLGCTDPDGQTWAVVVGNESTHQSFDNFNEVVSQATYEERWYFKWQTFQWVYYGHINVDGKDIDHHWYGNLFSGPSNNGNRVAGFQERSFQMETSDINVYPNPAKAYFTIDFGTYEKEIKGINIINISGQKIHYESIDQSTIDSKTISTSDWANGVYTLVIENSDGSAEVKRVIINQ